MTDEATVVRSISWRDLCPWTMLFRVFRISISLPLLVLALIGACAVPLGWRMAGGVLLTDESRQDAAVQRLQRQFGALPGELTFDPTNTAQQAPDATVDSPPEAGLPALWKRLGAEPRWVPQYFVEPFLWLFRPTTTGRQLFYVL